MTLTPLPLVTVAASYLSIGIAKHTMALGLMSIPTRNLFAPTSVMVAASASSSTSTAEELQNNRPSSSFGLPYPLTQVVSDIDDTLKSSGGVTVAGVSLGGIDVQYDRGDFYPGVFQFMWEISLFSVVTNQRYYDEYGFERGGGRDSVISSSIILSPPKVAVLTARAEELKAALEIKDNSKLAQAFRKTGESSKMYPTMDWGIGPVLYGSVSEWIIQHRKGLRKFNNFERLLEQGESQSHAPE